MRGNFFLDTSILVRTFDRATADKRDRARELVSQALSEGTGMLSWQVVQEFLSAATTKFEVPLSARDAADYLAAVLWPLCRVFPTADTYTEALRIRESAGFPFRDSLIIASARQGGARVLYSEDLQDGRVFDELRIENPFSA